MIIRKSEIKSMSLNNLKNKIKELRMELIKSRAKSSSKTPPDNPGRVKHIRRTIARMLTEINQRGNK